MNKLLIIGLATLLTACGDPNSKPKYGKDGYFAVNCRAYIQESVDGWRSGTYDTDATMDAIESHCGAYGDLWD